VDRVGAGGDVLEPGPRRGGTEPVAAVCERGRVDPEIDPAVAVTNERLHDRQLRRLHSSDDQGSYAAVGEGAGGCAGLAAVAALSVVAADGLVVVDYFPTRRSSDLVDRVGAGGDVLEPGPRRGGTEPVAAVCERGRVDPEIDPAVAVTNERL